MMKKKIFLFTLAIASILLVIYIVTVVGESDAQGETETEDIKEMVLGYSTDKMTAEAASIDSEKLVVMENGQETAYTLPEEEFFVSIAPFKESTHPCAIHSLTGCQGEMVEEEFDVLIEDSKGEVIVDEKMKTFENGFLDFWLPRDETFTVSLTHEGKTVTSELTTFEGDNTCITTIQL